MCVAGSVLCTLEPSYHVYASMCLHVYIHRHVNLLSKLAVEVNIHTYIYIHISVSKLYILKLNLLRLESRESLGTKGVED